MLAFTLSLSKKAPFHPTIKVSTCIIFTLLWFQTRITQSCNGSFSQACSSNPKRIFLWIRVVVPKNAQLKACDENRLLSCYWNESACDMNRKSKWLFISLCDVKLKSLAKQRDKPGVDCDWARNVLRDTPLARLYHHSLFHLCWPLSKQHFLLLLTRQVVEGVISTSCVLHCFNLTLLMMIQPIRFV